MCPALGFLQWVMHHAIGVVGVVVVVMVVVTYITRHFV